jgi:hypothetical protein
MSVFIIKNKNMLYQTRMPSKSKKLMRNEGKVGFLVIFEWPTKNNLLSGCEINSE